MRLAELLEREGGRILAAFAFLLIAGVWTWLRLPEGNQLIVAASTLIARELVGSRTNNP